MQFFKENHKREYAHFHQQRIFIGRAFPSFTCEVSRNVLTCRAELIPSEGCAAYSVLINYSFRSLPHVRVSKPSIPKELWSSVHIFPHSGELCLFDCRPEGQPWQWTHNIHETIIPWTAEWLVYYELFLVVGKWLGPEATHVNPKVSYGKK